MDGAPWWTFDSHTVEARHRRIKPPSERRPHHHVWIEYYDAPARQWRPADPTLNLIGEQAWSEARLGFGARPVHAIIPSRDMLVPIAVLAETGNPAHPFEDRTHHYLVDGFAAAIPAARARPQWRAWVREIDALHPQVLAAFQGQHNLHQDDEAIDEVRATYLAMRGRG